MKTTYVSSQSVPTATRISIQRMQAELVDRQQETATGRFADIGLALGARTGQAVSLRQEHARLDSLAVSNGLVAGRLDATQASLDGILKSAQAFLGSLIDARGSSPGAAIVEDKAQAALATFTADVNATHQGEYLFAGINTDVEPLGDYFGSPAAAGRQAVGDAFAAAFGVSQSDAGVAGISAADMQAFLDGAFATLFEEPAWSGDWSAASDQPIRSRISSAELIASGTTAQTPAMRAIAMTYTMVADLGVAGLSQDAYRAVLDKAVATIGKAITGIVGTQSQIGASQQRLAATNDRMAIQKGLLAEHIDALEGVDPYEASTRVNELLTQIETSYALTARLQQLSLLNYL